MSSRIFKALESTIWRMIFIVIGDRLAGAAALEGAIVALRIKEAVFIKAGFLEAVIDVGGEDEIVFPF